MKDLTRNTHIASSWKIKIYYFKTGFVRGFYCVPSCWLKLFIVKIILVLYDEIFFSRILNFSLAKRKKIVEKSRLVNDSRLRCALTFVREPSGGFRHDSSPLPWPSNSDWGSERLRQGNRFGAMFPPRPQSTGHRRLCLVQLANDKRRLEKALKKHSMNSHCT